MSKQLLDGATDMQTIDVRGKKESIRTLTQILKRPVGRSVERKGGRDERTKSKKKALKNESRTIDLAETRLHETPASPNRLLVLASELA